MSAGKSEFPDDKTKSERRKNLSEREIRDLEMAGGVEGGMQAGSAGGPGEKEAQELAEKSADQPHGGAEKPRAPKH